MESLHEVPTGKKENTATLTLETGKPVLLRKSTRRQKKKTRCKETSAINEGGLQTEFCLSKRSPSPLLWRAEERETGAVGATGLAPVCENRAKWPGHCEAKESGIP